MDKLQQALEGIAKEILSKYSDLTIDDYKVVVHNIDFELYPITTKTMAEFNDGSFAMTAELEGTELLLLEAKCSKDEFGRPVCPIKPKPKP
ncbi:hypothetical protein DYU11_03360 [Fibrisoma montanum]|uniref:Uncharacterized protein n=1 Tax=Fibrisoma montanum TaxID=2305895 RepID=A0A418MIX3_9BACT|nr:hypothetical protein [Fibrisoma montanum]RIV27364.1 hypothetical protein DYU11_03360 [Fibrisoma montanum]